MQDVADDDDVDEVVPEEKAVSGSDDVHERCLDVDADCSADVEIGADVDEPTACLDADEDRPCGSGVLSFPPAESSQVFADNTQRKDAVAGTDESLYSHRVRKPVLFEFSQSISQCRFVWRHYIMNGRSHLAM